MKWLLQVLVLLFFASEGISLHAQTGGKAFGQCDHDVVITVLRAYEDSLAVATSSTVVRVDYAWRVTDLAVAGKVYKIYRCEALYDSLTVLIDAVDFARATPPVVDTDSISGVSASGATFHAMVTSDGGEAVTAQWFRYGTSAASLVDSAAVAGTATPFTASVSTLTAGTTYFVAGFARNAKGTTPGDTLSFTTWAAPTVDTQPASSISATAVTLNATFTDGGSTVTATGFKYATNAALTSPTDVASSGTSSPFTGALTGLTHATQYWAVGYATNAVGTSYGDTITFTTSAIAPTVDTDAASSVTATGATLNATITATGGAAVSATGFKYATNAALTSPTDVAGSGTSSSFTGALTGLTHATQYWAVGFATNAVGTSYGDTITFTTSAIAPTVDTDAASSVTATAATLNATITATGGAAVTATGFKYATNAALTSPTDVAGSGTSSPFTGALTGLTHATQYWAVGYATNSVGTSYGDTITFTTSAIAPTVDTDAATSVTATGATLNATITATGGAAVSATGFKYATNAALTSPTDVAGSGTSSPFTGALTGLTHATQYWAVGYATNAVGTSYGDTITFTTSALAPTVDTDAASSVTATAATLNATITATGGAAVSATGFKYATNAALTSPTDVAGSGTSSPFTAGLTGLTAGTQYWAVGYATNTVGTSYGDTITFTTPAAPTLDTQAASSVTASSATLNATFTDGGSAVTATGFKYATNALLTSPSDVAGSGTSSPFTKALTGLTASTQYWAVGYATNSVGTSYGDTITFTTSAAPGFSCGTSTVTYDGHAYATVLIGTQCWFKENLQTDQYLDGTAITGMLDNATWSTTSQGAQAVLDEGGANESANLAAYGRIYNGHVVKDSRGLCPTGWHVPTNVEWGTLVTYVGTDPGLKLKATSPTWNGTDAYGFLGIPAPWRGTAGVYNNLGTEAYFWTTTEVSSTSIYRRSLLSSSTAANASTSSFQRGLAVRCLKD